MLIKNMAKEDLEILSYADLTELILKEENKPLNTPTIFKKICELLDYSEDEYVNLVVDFLELLPQNTTIHRLAGNGLKKNLIAPRWLGAKLDCLNKIDREFIKRNSFQSSKYNLNL